MKNKRRRRNSSEKTEFREWGKDISLGSVLAEQLYGAGAVVVEMIVNILRQIVANSGSRNGDTRRPLFDELVDMGEPMVPRESKFFRELVRAKLEVAKGFGANRPDSRDPGQVRA